jgi:two-component system phosphate regulon response regulator PhoB/two-component system alkaline phosphatase synthesis response regulator PhoP
MGELIAIVDDEPDILELVKLHLENSGFQAKGLPDAGSLYTYLEGSSPDLIILDLMLPDADGFDVCKQLRKEDKFSSIPIIMLTAKGEEVDKVLGLELGADDYVTKPFSPKELVARVKAVLRRQQKKTEENKIKIGNILSLDPEKYEVTVSGKKVELTTTEFRILQLLASRRGFVFSRDRILDYLWGHEKIVIDRTVDVHIRNLREKLGKAARFIKNVRGVGYKLVE